jgi:DNA-binding IclR family transcriptional regulator
MLDILEFLSENSRSYGVTELSRELGISTNLVFRIMKRLTERGYAEMDSESGGYQLSTRFFTLGMRLYSRFDLRNRSRKHLEWLTQETGETCQIQVPDGNRMLVRESVNPPVDYFLQIVPGSRVYYHANAFGKVILAFMDQDEVKELLPTKLPALTEKTITNRKVLLGQLDQIKLEGIAYDDEEYTDGFFCIGSPVFDVSGKAIAGVGMTGLIRRFDAKLKKKTEKLVLQCASRIASDIGYTGDYYSLRLK